MATVKPTVSPATAPPGESNKTVAAQAPTGPPRTPLNQIYALPAPIRTFPLPTFYPNNPISLFHLVYAWLKQALSPPPAEPSVIHIGIWDPDTCSVHVPDAASIRALWEQGFFGKGSLSRSEPNWLKRELARRGSPEGKTVSEVRTEARREERRLAKWERAKTELEAIERQRLAEAALQAPSPVATEIQLPEEEAVPAKPPPLKLPKPVVKPLSVSKLKNPVPTGLPSPPLENGVINGHVAHAKSPVGPAEILALPNSLAKISGPINSMAALLKPPTGPAELLALPNSTADLVTKSGSATTVMEVRDMQSVNGVVSGEQVNGISPIGQTGKASAFAQPLDGSRETHKPIFPEDLLPTPCCTPTKRSAGGSSAQDREESSQPAAKRQKSVRFSPKVESTTFNRADPPSPGLASPAEPAAAEPVPKSDALAAPTAPLEIQDKEHFQLAPEEAFFLAFSLGALKVIDPKTEEPIPNERLLSLFRSYSYFPPSAGLRPDDPFLVNYAVYHHFRSLGWVPRHGIKFGVDWILYQRGPVFDHSEFGLMVMPAFSDARWKEYEHQKPKKSWSWLMGVNRVLSHVLKSLVLIYVDVPPPSVFDEAMKEGGIAAALKKYKIREVMVRRFSVNRNR
ncbi:putative tRNA-splicing endonuclease subunit sen-2 [Triangularia setosa]|uniref:tRNA-intron lyase n=1 Tax=Triangularia setosa TaxID=2587417 RepID=A0AAN7A6Q7_9PEZI|nr:putative tRNA-splicing endonuclease subunit sen-2 [Podospora setosa]